MLLLENDRSNTPLHLACCLSKSVNIIKMLMHKKDDDGKHLATKRNKMTRLPLMISIIESDFMTYNETSTESDLPINEVHKMLFVLQPVFKSEFTKDEYFKMVEKLADFYIDTTMVSMQRDSFGDIEQHGWVEFVSKVDIPTAIDKCVSLIENNDTSIEKVRWLAEAKDQDKRRALDVAKSNIREAMQKRLLFMGRYDIDLLYIHKSDTCIVVKASDVTTEKLYEEKFDKYNKSSKSDRLTKEEFIDALKDLGTGLDDNVNNVITFDSTFTKWDLDGDC